MNAEILLRGISQLVTPVAPGPVHGRAMRGLNVIPDAAIGIRAGKIEWCGPFAEWSGKAEAEFDCKGSAVVPALIDPHTHAVWAGDRLADFEARVSGVTYERILAVGGGIRSTVRATVAASVEELISGAIPRVEQLMRSGAATIEVKSGYGLDPEVEIRILESIALLSERVAARIVPTLLLHLPFEPARVTGELIPEVARRGLAKALDIFVEREAWSAADALPMIRLARELGLPFKLHTEQFHRVGGLEMGIAEGALSVDHLEVAVAKQFSRIAASQTVATILPGVTLHLGIAAAPGRALIDAGAAIAIGTDLNPGSSPLFSAQLALALAVRLNGLTPHEALTASTVNAAAALGLFDCGRLAPGLRADFLVLDSPDWRDLAYALGGPVIREVWIGGRPT